MCEHKENIFSWAVDSPRVSTIKSSGSRRRRLWDLPTMCHCPVIGVCLPLDVLRKLVLKHADTLRSENDYAIHVAAVGHCERRNRLAETLNEELDQRYRLTIQKYRALQDEVTLQQVWECAVKDGDVAAALWAILSHPHAGVILMERVVHDMHMLQHQAGAAKRIDLHAYQTIRQALAEIQTSRREESERHARQLSERDRKVDALETELARLKVELAGKDSLVDSLKRTVADLHTVMPDVAGVRRLRVELDTLRAHCRVLEKRLFRESGARTPSVAEAIVPVEAVEPEMTSQVDVPCFEKRTILCVGGRTRAVTAFRSLVEDAGGQFAFHDGGFENSLHQLDSTLAAADLVICQTGCISHNAYWRVKSYCKRTGKRCVFVESPGRSGLLKQFGELALAQDDGLESPFGD